MKKSFRATSIAIAIAICIAMEGLSTVFADEMPEVQTKAEVMNEMGIQMDNVQPSDDDISLEDIENTSENVIREENSEIKENTDIEDTNIALSVEAEETISEFQTAEEKGQLHQEVDDYGNKYMVYDDGSHYTGWYNMEPFGWLYFDSENNGAAAKGKHQITDDGVSKSYLFNNDGINLRTPGTPIIDGNKYWIKEDGSLGQGWLYLGRWKMYFDPSTFWARTVSDKVVDIKGQKYLFNADGVMQTFAGTTVINGAKYWFAEEGYLKCGWLTLGNWTLYFDTETYQCATGITQIDGKNYLFDNNGVLLTSGTPVIDGKKYYIGTDNTLCTGWLYLGKWKMYFRPDTYVAYTASDGPVDIDGHKYLFDSNGVMQTYAGTPVINGKKYWFSDDNASLKSGWLNLNGAKLYFDPNTYAAYVNCTVRLDDYNCRFNKDGILINDKERDKKYINNLLTYNARPDIYDGGIDFLRAAKNIASDKSRGYGHTWPNTISCAGLVGLTLTHLGYGDFIKDDPLGWGYIDLCTEYENTLLNEVGATWNPVTITGANYMNYLQPGDILYAYTDQAENHIAFYAGNGKTIEARGPSGPTDADDTGYETGIYDLSAGGSYQGYFRIPADRIQHI